MSAKEFDGPERRQYFRYNLIYSPKDKATLTVGAQRYEVLDMSAGGLRFKNATGRPLEKQVRGLLTLANGETRAIEGEVVWEQQNEVGLRLTAPS